MRGLGLAMIGMILAACSPYVNIPEQPGDFASASINDQNALAVSTVALRRVIKVNPPDGSYSITLPRGASSASYRWVIDQLPGEVTRHEGGAIDRPVYSVAAVYIRGGKAHADVVYPTAAGEPRLMSVYQRLLIDGWFATRDRLWEVPVVEALAQSRPADAD